VIELAPDRIAATVGSTEPGPETEDGSRPERAVIDSREAHQTYGRANASAMPNMR